MKLIFFLKGFRLNKVLQAYVPVVEMAFAGARMDSGVISVWRVRFAASEIGIEGAHLQDTTMSFRANQRQRTS